MLALALLRCQFLSPKAHWRCWGGWHLVAENMSDLNAAMYIGFGSVNACWSIGQQGVLVMPHIKMLLRLVLSSVQTKLVL